MYCECDLAANHLRLDVIHAQRTERPSLEIYLFCLAVIDSYWIMPDFANLFNQMFEREKLFLFEHSFGQKLLNMSHSYGGFLLPGNIF